VFEAGGITHGSLMANGRSAFRMSQRSAAVGLPLGLHLNLSEGSPISDARDVPTLVGSDGMFLGKEAFHRAAASGALRESEVAAEVGAQLSRVRAMLRRHGSRPSHADGHQHCHVHPVVARPLAAALALARVPRVRIPALCSAEERGEAFRRGLPPARRAFYELIASRAARSRALYSRAGLVAPACFVGYSTMGAGMADAPRVVGLVREAAGAAALLPAGRAGPFAVELMCHPGMATTADTVEAAEQALATAPGPGLALAELAGCGSGPDEFSASADREVEAASLPGIAVSLRKLGFRL